MTGEYEAARRYAEEKLSHGGGKVGWSVLLLANALFSEGRLPEARKRYLHVLSIMGEGAFDILANLGALERLTALDVLEGRWEQAARLFGACEACRDAIQTPLSPSGHTDFYDAALAGLHAALDADAFTAAWEKGRQMTFSQAIEYAMEESEV
jgi:hypothetical protein